MRKVRKSGKLVHNWGINDANYTCESHLNGVRVCCPYYKKWADMITRCKGVLYLSKYPSYIGSKICEDWRYFSNFKRWVEEQPNINWKSCELDKDVLIRGNRLYSPDTCVFISKKVNRFLTRGNTKGTSTLNGVTDIHYKNPKNPFEAKCCNPFEKGNYYIGCFATELEAHKAWQAKKHEYACQLADLQEDERVAKALRERYAPDKDWTKV